MLKAIKLIVLANMKLELRSMKVFVATMIVPLTYPLIFIFQIYLSYKVNPNAFYGLSFERYLVCLFVTQNIFWLTYDKSARDLMNEVLSSQLDIHLLKPVNLFFYKYCRRFDLSAFLTLLLNGIALIVCFINFKTPLFTIIKLEIFIILASVLIMNFKCAIYGLIFYRRDANELRRIHLSLEDLTYNKPPDIFPSTLQFVLTFILPYLIVQSYSFNIIRGSESIVFWITAVIWCCLAICMNHFIWSNGLKKYESTG